MTRYELTEGTGGRGRWRGGLGSIREFEFTEPGGFSIEGDGSKFPPPGSSEAATAPRERFS